MPWAGSATGYIGWVCVEAPEAIFEDVIEVTAPSGQGHLRTDVSIDPRHVECCEPNSLRAVAVALSSPGWQPGTRVEHGVLIVDWHLEGWEQRPMTARITVEGTRLGHAERWREYTREQYEANVKFWSGLKGGALPCVTC